MVVDYLRSCYSTTARLIAGQPQQELPITWYWAAEGADLLPHRTSINSINWWPDRSPDPAQVVGEIPGRRRTWRDGSMPDRPAGKHFHGTPEEFVNGATAGQPRPRSPSGPLVDCYPRPFGVVCCPGKAMPEWMYAHVRNPAGVAVHVPRVIPLRQTHTQWFGSWSADLGIIPGWPTHGGEARRWWWHVRCVGGGDPPCKGWRMYSTEGAYFGMQTQVPTLVNGPCTCDRVRMWFQAVFVNPFDQSQVGKADVWVSEWKDPANDPGIPP